MPLRAAIRCIRFLSASRSDSGLGGGSLPAPHYAVLLSIPRLVSVILLSVNVMTGKMQLRVCYSEYFLTGFRDLLSINT